MAGSITVTPTDIGGGFTKYSIAWVSDGTGVVSATAFSVKRGRLVAIKYFPGAGGVQPTDLYDMTILDADNFDVLANDGQNLSNVNAKLTSPAAPFFLEGGNLTPTIAAAGVSKQGTVNLYVGPG